MNNRLSRLMAQSRPAPTEQPHKPCPRREPTWVDHVLGWICVGSGVAYVGYVSLAIWGAL